MPETSLPRLRSSTGRHGDQGEFPALLDQSKPPAREVEGPPINTLNPLTGLGFGIVEPQFTRKLSANTGQFPAPQDATHVGSIDGPVLLITGKLLFNQPLPAPGECILNFPAKATIAQWHGCIRDKLPVKPGGTVRTNLSDKRQGR